MKNMKTFIEKHKLLNHPFAEMVAWFIAGNVCLMIVFSGVAEIVTDILSHFGMVSPDSAGSDIVWSLVAIAGGMILLWYFYRHYRPCFKGFGWLENCKQKEIMICMAIFMGVDLIIWAIDIARLGGIVTPSPATLVGALQPGITEEIIDRILPLAAAMYVFKERKSVVPLLIFTSVLFGATHIFNVFAGADLGPTIVQVFSAGAAGVFMAAVYLRTGSFLPGMLVHFLHDFISFLAEGMDVATGAVAVWDIVEVLIFGTVQLILTYFLIKGKNESIQAVWNKIWAPTQLASTHDNQPEHS